MSCARPVLKKRKAAAPRQENAAFENKPQQHHTALKASCTVPHVLASKATSTVLQRQRALELLKIAPQTTYSLRRKGISHPAQRLKELIRNGYLITSTRVTAVDSDGYTHVGVALYSLAMPTAQSEANPAPEAV